LVQSLPLLHSATLERRPERRHQAAGAPLLHGPPHMCAAPTRGPHPRPCRLSVATCRMRKSRPLQLGPLGRAGCCELQAETNLLTRFHVDHCAIALFAGASLSADHVMQEMLHSRTKRAGSLSIQTLHAHWMSVCVFLLAKDAEESAAPVSAVQTGHSLCAAQGCGRAKGSVRPCGPCDRVCSARCGPQAGAPFGAAFACAVACTVAGCRCWPCCTVPNKSKF